MTEETIRQAIGGHVDLLFGTDWRFGVNHGLEDRINSFSDQDYGMVIPQAYMEVAFNNLSVKLGHFAAILDYEVIPAPMNQNGLPFSLPAKWPVKT